MTAGRAIVEVLKAEGMKAVYGIPGGHVLPIYDGLYDTKDISHFLVRHEQAAASMAAAYAQLTGEAAVCLVTAGPGATNLVTNVAEAFVGALPMVILAGRGATATTFRGASQEVDTELVFRPSPNGRSASTAPTSFRMRCTKPLPWHATANRVQSISISRATYCCTRFPSVLTFRQARLHACAASLSASRLHRRSLPMRRNPLIVAGGGTIASGASAAVTALAKRLSAPVITTLAGRGVIDDDHPLSVGGLGAHRNPLSKRLLAEADVIVSLGARFEEMETNWRPGFVPPSSARVIQVDIDPAEIGRSVPAQLGIIGDIRAVVEEMLDALGARPRLAPVAFGQTQNEYGAELKRLAEDVAEQAASLEKPIHPLRVIRAVRQALPREATVASTLAVWHNTWRVRCRLFL